MATIDEKSDPRASNLYDINASDPEGRLVDRASMDPKDIQHVGEVMAALGRLRSAENELSEASMKYMKLNQSDMRALHYLIVTSNTQEIATPGAIAAHLKISTASTTKLLDRLEKAGHIVRQPHPSDRRALAITITAKTKTAAMETVGKQQAKRFYAAARLTSEQRDVIIGFLDDMTQEISLGDEAWTQPGAQPG